MAATAGTIEMLVFYAYPRGSTIVDGKRIYGYMEPYEPVKISWDAYRSRKKDFIQAAYNKANLEKMFPGREFPDISFNYHEIRELDWNDMCALCKAFGITTNRCNRLRRRKLREFIKENC